MKLFLAFLIFLTLCKVSLTRLPLGFKNTALEKAFVSITEALVRRNWLTSIFTKDNFSHSIHLASLASIADIPHVAVALVIEKMNFAVNSSAIIALNSVSNLEKFNIYLILPEQN